MRPAREPGPDQPVAIDVDAARSMTDDAVGRFGIEGRLVHLGAARGRRIAAELHAQDASGDGGVGPPDRAVGRVHDDAVREARDSHVLVRLGRTSRLRVLTDLPVAAGIHDHRAPALSRGALLRAIPGGGLDPPNHVDVAGEVKRLLFVFGELQVVGAETRIDGHDLPRARIVHGGLPGASLEREVLRVGVVRARAVRRVAQAAHGRRHPHPLALIHHRIVRIDGVVPDQVLTEVRRGGLDLLRHVG